MVSRREILQMGIAASALTMLPTSVSGGATCFSDVTGEQIPVYKVIFEQTSSLGRAFATEASALGLPIHGIKFDVTDLYYHELASRWKQGPTVLAGLTFPTTLFCLESLAGDYRMRVRFRADHECLGVGQVSHAFSGRSYFVDRAAQISTHWSRGFADLVARAGGSPSAKTQKTIVATSEGSFSGDSRGMVSWIITPRDKARSSWSNRGGE